MVPVKQRITTLVLIAAVIVLLDQVSKYLVVHYLTRQVVIVPGFLDLVSVYNRGVAFETYSLSLRISR